MGDSEAYRLHIIVDISYLYHRHVYGYRDGQRRKVYGMIKDSDSEYYNTEKDLTDITMQFSVLRDLETIRSLWINRCTELVVSICFDSKSHRKDKDENYKSNRKGLDQSDFEKLNMIRKIVTDIGYNVYKKDGMEADDLITSLVTRYKHDFDFTLLYTPDSDILVNLDSNVGVMRYKWYLADYSRGRAMEIAHVPIAVSNFSKVMGVENKCEMPYNTTILYKCTVGDKSDVVKGIKGFGVKAYDKLLASLRAKGVTDETFSKMGDPEVVSKVIESLRGELGDDKVNEALESLELVKFKDVDVDKPEKRDSYETRKEVYSKYDMGLLVW